MFSGGAFGLFAVLSLSVGDSICGDEALGAHIPWSVVAPVESAFCAERPVPENKRTAKTVALQRADVRLFHFRCWGELD